MDVRAYVVQATIAVLATVLLAFTPLWWWGLVLTTLYAITWLILNTHYARSLSDYYSRAQQAQKAGDDARLPEDCTRSVERAQGDTVVARWSIGAPIVGLAACIVVPIVGTQVTSDVTSGVGAAGLVTIPTVMSASTLIDWYYIRPLRDGIVCDPPCKRTDKTSRAFWQQVTRMWYLQRTLTIILVFLATILGLTALILGAVSLGSGAQGAVLASVLAATLVVVQVIYDLRALSIATTRCALRPPDIVLGDVLSSDAAQANGFVLDVAVEGISVVREPGADSRFRPLAEVATDNSVALNPYPGCRYDTCSRIIPMCQQADQITREAKPPPNRRLIL